MSDFLREFQSCLRRAARRPTFFLLATLLLGVGFGATLLVASLYDQIAVRSLAADRPEQLALVHKMLVSADGHAEPLGRFSLADCRALRRDASALLDLACFEPGDAVAGFDTPARVPTQTVTANYFELLGLRPQAGRLFAIQDDNADPGVVLSHGAWLRRFAGDPAAIGRSLLLDGHSATILGIAPSDFHGIKVGGEPEIYRLANAGQGVDGSYAAIARLAPGPGPGQGLLAAETKLRTLNRALAESRPGQQAFLFVDGKMTRATERIDVVPGQSGESDLRGGFSRSLLLAGGMLALVVLILCFNLANLLAARAVHERRQNAVRRALGATGLRLAAAWLGDSLLLCVAGAGLGILLADLGGPSLLAALPEVQSGATLAFAIDHRVLLMGLALSVLTAALVGSLAAWEASRSPTAAILRGGAAGRNARQSSRWRWALVGAQCALSIVLLVGMSLLATSLGRLLRLETGLPLERVLAFTVDLQKGGTASDGTASDAARLERIREAVAAVPGVDVVSFSTERILAGSSWFTMGAVEGYHPVGSEVMAINTVPVSPGFFETLGLRLLRGRTFTPRETAAGSHAALVNRSFAERYLTGDQPLGRHISFDMQRGDWSAARADDLEVVGVVADAALADVKEQATPRLYTLVDASAEHATFYLRGSRSPADLAADVLPALRRDFAAAAVGPVTTLAEQRDRLLGREHLLRGFSLALGLLGALITAIGLYGVLGLMVSSRGRELAVRLALGARDSAIARLVARQAGGAVALGTVAGLAASVPATTLLRGFLFGVEPGDWHALAAAVGLLLAVAALACWLPVRRATRTDPAAALRAD